MKDTIDTPAILSGEPGVSVTTAAVDDDDLASPKLLKDNVAGWNRVIDHSLVEWGRNPDALEDEDFDPPSVETINLACRVALYFRDEGLASPLRVAPDGNGGICFERRDEEFFESLIIRPDRSVELLTFQDCRLRGRLRLL